MTCKKYRTAVVAHALYEGSEKTRVLVLAVAHLGTNGVSVSVPKRRSAGNAGFRVGTQLYCDKQTMVVSWGVTRDRRLPTRVEE